MGGTTTATRTANCKLAKYPSSIYTEGLTDRRRRRRNPPAMTRLVPQFAKGGSPAAPGGSERKVMFAVFERNVLPVIPKIPRASLKVLPPPGSVIPRVHRVPIPKKLVLCGKVVPPKWV